MTFSNNPSDTLTWSDIFSAIDHILITLQSILPKKTNRFPAFKLHSMCYTPSIWGISVHDYNRTNSRFGASQPDTDAIASAIGYAWMLNQTHVEHQAGRVGPVNTQTAFVLQRFGIDAPPLVGDVRSRVSDVTKHCRFCAMVSRCLSLPDHRTDAPSCRLA
jgi:hypothetical protein